MDFLLSDMEFDGDAFQCCFGNAELQFDAHTCTHCPLQPPPPPPPSPSMQPFLEWWGECTVCLSTEPGPLHDSAGGDPPTGPAKSWSHMQGHHLRRPHPNSPLPRQEWANLLHSGVPAVHVPCLSPHCRHGKHSSSRSSPMFTSTAPSTPHQSTPLRSASSLSTWSTAVMWSHSWRVCVYSSDFQWELVCMYELALACNSQTQCTLEIRSTSVHVTVSDCDRHM